MTMVRKLLLSPYSWLLAFAFFGLSFQHPVNSEISNTPSELSKRGGAYVQYSGPASNFPAMSKFMPYEDMWKLNLPTLSASGNTESDIANIKSAINQCAKESRVDRRLVLGMMMQESRGDVGVITTYNPYATAGLMQCINCPGFPGQHGISKGDITNMICGGVKHFKCNMEVYGDKWSGETVWPALRAYNSGTANLADLSDGKGATASYVSDLANRVTGWSN